MTVSFMISSKAQLSEASPNTTSHLAVLLSHHSLLHPPCYLWEMSGFFLAEPMDNGGTKMTQERFQSFFKTLPAYFAKGYAAVIRID